MRNNYSRVSTNPGEPSGFSDISMVSVFSWCRAGHVTHKYQALTDALQRGDVASYISACDRLNVMKYSYF